MILRTTLFSFLGSGNASRTHLPLLQLNGTRSFDADGIRPFSSTATRTHDFPPALPTRMIPTKSPRRPMAPVFAPQPKSLVVFFRCFHSPYSSFFHFSFIPLHIRNEDTGPPTPPPPPPPPQTLPAPPPGWRSAPRNPFSSFLGLGAASLPCFFPSFHPPHVRFDGPVAF